MYKVLSCINIFGVITGLIAIPTFPTISYLSYFLARLTESMGSYCHTPGVRRRRRCRRRRRPHFVKVSLQPLISQITLQYLAYVLQEDTYIVYCSDLTFC